MISQPHRRITLRRAGYERWLRNLAVGSRQCTIDYPVLEARKRREHPSAHWYANMSNGHWRNPLT
jgi:hypothetical protein